MVKQYDLIVAGGGMSGVSAAVTGSEMGLKVLLIEQNAFLGGMGTAGLITMIMTSKRWFYGLGKSLIEKMIRTNRARFIENPQVDGYHYYPYDGEEMKRELEELVISSGAELLMYTKIIGVEKKDHQLTGLVLSGMEGEFSIRGKYFVDATGDAYLCRMAGEKVVYGDDDANVQAPSMLAYYAGIDFERYEKFLQVFDDGRQAAKINMIHTLMPKAVEEKIVSECDLHHPGIFRISETADIGIMNAGHVYGADCHSSAGLTAATVKGRKIAKEYLEFYRKYVPGFENAYMTNTGSTLALRETYRLEGQYVTTFEDKCGYVKFDDTIMRFDGGNVSDLHSSSADIKAYDAYKKLFFAREHLREDDYATLPFRSMKGTCTDNLLTAGRCVSADRKTLGQIRIMGYCFMMGQAAGVAACLASRERKLFDQIDVTELQAELARLGIETI